LLTEEMVLILAPNEDIETSSTFGANLFAGFTEPKRQKFADIAAEATEVLVVCWRSCQYRGRPVPWIMWATHESTLGNLPAPMAKQLEHGSIPSASCSLP
jgi:hypothetical protein